MVLRDIHEGLPANYDCEDSAPPPAQPGARARPGHNSQDDVSHNSHQDGVSHQEEGAPPFLPQLNRLHEVYIVWGEDDSNVAVAVIPAQHRVTQQIIRHCQ